MQLVRQLHRSGDSLAGHIDKPLQGEWNTHGEPAFQYEILETLEADLLLWRQRT
jgi:hypothetical protein